MVASSRFRRHLLFVVIFEILLSLSGLWSAVEISAGTLQQSLPNKVNASFSSNNTPVITSLVSNRTEDVENLCRALESLDSLNDNYSTDVLVFHEDLHDVYVDFLKSCTHNRTIIFPRLAYSFDSSFPKSFNASEEQPNWRKRTKWGYHQMVRFWITKIWEQPILDKYDTLMRLDSDSCWTSNDDGTIPILPQKAVYLANKENSDAVKYCRGLPQFAMDYVAQHNIQVKNPSLWKYRVMPTRAGKIRGMNVGCDGYSNHFEISRISFMRRPDVVAWHNALTEHEPFGVFRWRWGDALARLITMAIFADPKEVINDRGLYSVAAYEHPCSSRSMSKRVVTTEK